MAPQKAERRRLTVRLVLGSGLTITGIVALLYGGRAWHVACLRHEVKEALALGHVGRAALLADQWVFWRREAEAYVWRSRTRWLRGNAIGAAEDLLAAREHDWPAEYCEVERLLLVASLGRFDEVEPQLRSLFFSRLTNDAEISAALARGYTERYELEKARLCVDRWIEQAPKDYRAYLLRPKIVERLRGDKAEVHRDYTTAARLAPRNYEANFEAAQWSLKLTKVDDAERYFEQCCALDRDREEAWMGLARCAIHRGDEGRAMTLVNEVLARHPDSPAALVLAAELGLAQGRQEDAVVQLQRAVTLEPHHHEAWHWLAVALSRSGRPAEAEAAKRERDRLLALFDRCEKLRERVLERPHDAAILSEIIDTFQKLGQPQEAERWSRRLAQLQPNTAMATAPKP